MFTKKITDFSRVKIHEITSIGPGTELEDLTAIYPCKVKWSPSMVTPCLIQSPQEEIIEEVVKIRSISTGLITQGFYLIGSLSASPLSERLLSKEVKPAY